MEIPVTPWPTVQPTASTPPTPMATAPSRCLLKSLASAKERKCRPPANEADMYAPIITPITLAAPKPGRPSAADLSVQSMVSATCLTKLKEAGWRGCAEKSSDKMPVTAHPAVAKIPTPTPAPRFCGWDRMRDTVTANARSGRSTAATATPRPVRPFNPINSSKAGRP